MASHALAVSVVVACAATLGCASKADRDAKDRRLRAEIATEYARLRFMIPLLDATSRATIPCDDAALPSRLKRTPRFCEKLALTDEANVRRLFGGGAAPSDVDAAAWMRTSHFRVLQPASEIPAGLDLSSQRGRLARLGDTNVGIFTRDTTPASEGGKRYRGWLLIVDTVEEKLRCQVQLDVDVSKVEASASRYDGSVGTFLREVDRQLTPITKNFCAE